MQSNPRNGRIPPLQETLPLPPYVTYHPNLSLALPPPNIPL